MALTCDQRTGRIGQHFSLTWVTQINTGNGLWVSSTRIGEHMLQYAPQRYLILHRKVK
jgi:hypothetical protein